MLTCIPDVLEPDQLRRCGALIAECAFVDGRATAGHRAKSVKHNLQLDPTSAGVEQLVGLLHAALAGNRAFQEVSMARVVRLPTISRYLPGMAYGPHSDNSWMGRQPDRIRSDVAATLFLSDPTSYDGGELVVHSAYGDQTVKLPAGAAVVYPASTLHEVAPVTRGERLAAVFWAQSYVREPLYRELLADMRKIQGALNGHAPGSEEARLAYHVYHNLVRVWSDS